MIDHVAAKHIAENKSAEKYVRHAERVSEAYLDHCATITRQAAQIKEMQQCLRELCTSEEYSIGEAELRLIDSALTIT